MKSMGMQQFELVRITPRGEFQDSVGLDLDELYSVRDRMNAKSLASGKTLTEQRFAVRPLSNRVEKD